MLLGRIRGKRHRARRRDAIRPTRIAEVVAEGQAQAVEFRLALAGLVSIDFLGCVSAAMPRPKSRTFRKCGLHNRPCVAPITTVRKHNESFAKDQKAIGMASVLSIVRKRKDWSRMVKPSALRQSSKRTAQTTAFGRAVYALRIEKKLSQEELSFQSEIDRSYLGQLERGEKEPCLGVIFKIADALATPPSEIFRTIEHLRKEKMLPARRNARVR